MIAHRTSGPTAGAFRWWSSVREARQQAIVDWRWDLLFIFGALLLIMAGTVLTQALLAGDWSFWTDWKDRQFWPLVAPAVAIVIPSTVQYAVWTRLRLPAGATIAAVALFLAEWLSRSVNWAGWVYFPLNQVWPETFILGALLLDLVLLWTRSWLVTSLLGGFAWGALFLAQQHPALAPFLAPLVSEGHLLTVADLQGMEYIRTQTPEYLRVIERGSLRAFFSEITWITAAFSGAVCVGTYWVGQLIGRSLAVGPHGKFVRWRA